MAAVAAVVVTKVESGKSVDSIRNLKSLFLVPSLSIRPAQYTGPMWSSRCCELPAFPGVTGYWFMGVCLPLESRGRRNQNRGPPWFLILFPSSFPFSFVLPAPSLGGKGWTQLRHSTRSLYLGLNDCQLVCFCRF